MTKLIDQDKEYRAKVIRTVVVGVETFSRMLYQAPFDDSKLCDYCGERAKTAKCPFCGYPKDVEFLEGDECHPV